MAETAPDLPIVRAVKQCVFRTCDWTIAEPEDATLIAQLHLEIDLAEHLREEHQEAIVRMAEATGVLWR